MASYRFRDFELDSSRYELRRGGRNLRLEKIPMDLLILLVEKNDDLITREEIIERIWGKDVFTDSDAGINTAIRKIRQTLNDDPENPRFIQTAVGRGYRFLAPVTSVVPVEQSPVDINVAETNAPASEPPVSGHVRPRKLTVLWVTTSVVAVIALALIGSNVLRLRNRLLRRPAPVTIHSIAVLPLENFSGDPAEDYFADGMTDELTTNLAKVSSLGVIGRTSVMRYKGTHKSIPEIARELKVDFVVEGSVVRDGDNVRITAQLIDGPSGRHLWADDFERSRSDVLQLQKEVALKIVQQIRATLTPDETIRLSGARAVDPKAYEANLKGRSYWNQRSEAGIKKAIEQFNAAIQADGSYAEAYSGLADSYTALGYFSYLNPNDVFPLAKAAADKALELDPTLAEAHASLGYYNLYYAWNWKESEKEFRRAIALNPNYATAHDWYSVYLLAMGRPDEAMVEIRRAQQLDPLSPLINTDVGFQFYYDKRYDEAIQQLRNTLQTDPKFPLAHLWLGRAYQQKGMYEEAISEYRQTDTSWPEWVVSLAAIGNVEGIAGKTSEARDMLSKLNTLSEVKYVTPYGTALLYAGLGDKVQTFNWLGRAVQGRSHWLVWIRLDPRWEDVKTDPRFKEIIRSVGFPN
jgi:TolB-like protein/DNA-binding winged helix-turn-helix (wHTH) protein/Flp pilus assembly protein TadD